MIVNQQRTNLQNVLDRKSDQESSINKTHDYLNELKNQYDKFEHAHFNEKFNENEKIKIELD